MNARTLLEKVLAKCTRGQLRITDTAGSTTTFGNAPDELDAQITILDDTFHRRLLVDGEIGLGDAYIDEVWDSPDLTAALQWFVLNQANLDSDSLRWAQPIVSKIRALSERFAHWKNRNNLANSQRNIAEHYDLGNEFYAAFLDDTMLYSSAYFETDTTSLRDAQVEKIDRLCRKIDLQKGNHVLEIGCGWGSLAMHAAREYGCKVTAITLSQRQLDLANSRIQKAGLASQIDVQKIDYRHVEGQYDRILSVEMLEAVGHAYLPTFFQACDRLLKPEGLLGLQAILCADQRYDSYRKSADWIRKRVFPGGHLPSTKALFDATTDAENLNLYHFESFGLHYARTLRLWRQNFEAAWPSIEKLGFDEPFRRRWRYYLAVCEASFLERHVNVGQYVWGRSNADGYQFETPAAATPAQSTQAAS